MSTLEPEPDLGLTAEAVENGAEPDDALYVDRGLVPDAPEVADELDTAYGAAQARGQLAEALAAHRELQPDRGPEPDPEAVVDGRGCSVRDLEAYEAAMDAALDELEPDPEPETGDLMTNGIEADASRWSPEVLAYNDFPAIAERVAEREARREAEGAASRAAWAALAPAEQEAELARQDAEAEAEADLHAEREIEDPEAEIG